MKPYLSARLSAKPRAKKAGLSARGMVRGAVICPGDKSIAHRSIILSALTAAKTEIENFPSGNDCLSTVNAFKQLGIKIKVNLSKGKACVFGNGLCGLKKSAKPIFVAESGTTLRLLLGILAGQNFQTRLTAAKSLSSRPMKRVILPLRLMGAHINSNSAALRVDRRKSITDNRKPGIDNREEYPPITIKGGNLQSIIYKMPVASAQVKSAILLAGLYIFDPTTVIEPVKTRDHTERMLKAFRADIKTQGNRIIVSGRKCLVSPGKIFVPADISSAAFFMVLAGLLPGSNLRLKHVSLNPSRLGVLKVLKRMGADIQVIKNKRRRNYFELMGDIVIRGGNLNSTVIEEREVPSLIDELPVLMIAACLAKGRSVFKGVGELRFKETDRITAMQNNLRKMGADIEVVRNKKGENIVIKGVNSLKGAHVASFGDHRTAMSMAVAGILAHGETRIDDVSCISKSFPSFLSVLKSVVR